MPHPDAPRPRTRQGRRPGRGVCLLAGGALVLSGCGASMNSSVGTSSAPASGSTPVRASSAASASSATPRPSASLGAPADARLYGCSSTPAGFRLPGGLVMLETLCQTNVVTFVMTPDDGPPLAAWLRRQLPVMGYHVDAASTDSVVFSGSQWSGAFTSDDQVAALTLRHRS